MAILPDRWEVEAVCKACKKLKKLAGYVPSDKEALEQEIKEGYICDSCKTRIKRSLTR